LPRPFTRRVRRFPYESKGQIDTAKAIFEILFVLHFDSQQMTAQRFTHIQRKYGHAIFAAFGVANADLSELEIDVFDTKTDAFHQAQSAPVKQTGHQFGHAVQMREDCFTSLRDKTTANFGGFFARSTFSSQPISCLSTSL
jgi:hypothetical protein